MRRFKSSRFSVNTQSSSAAPDTRATSTPSETKLDGAESYSHGSGVTSDLDLRLESFEVFCNGTIEMLEAVSDLHPALLPITMVLKVAVRLELARVQVNRQIRILHLVMVDMMNIVRKLYNPQIPRDKQLAEFPLPQSLQEVLNTIRDGLRQFVAECEAFYRLHSLARIFKNAAWLKKLDQYARDFDNYKSRLQLELAVEAHDVARLNSIKLDQILTLLQDPPVETKLQKFVDKHGHGDVNVIVADDKLLEEAVRLYQQDSLGGPNSTMLPLSESDKARIRKEVTLDLVKALETTLDASLHKFQATYETLLREESNRIIREVRRGAYEEIADPIVRKLWADMKWKRCAKARYFVAALREFCAELLARKASLPLTKDGVPDVESFSPPAFAPPADGGNISTTMASSTSPVAPEASPGGRVLPKSMAARLLEAALLHAIPSGDEWTMKYISLLRVQPLLEVLDDDGSTFITVSEVNAFTSAAPKDWSIIRWMAYWTVGFPLSTEYYCKQIVHTLRYMRFLCDGLLLVNRSKVQTTLASCLVPLERTIAGVYNVGEDIPSWDKYMLSKTFQAYRTTQEDGIRSTLDVVKYSIDSSEALKPLFGARRLEEYLLPLLYFMADRLLDIVYTASERSLDDERSRELENIAGSFYHMWGAIQERVEAIESMCEIQNLPAKETLRKYALGMYYYSSDLSEGWLESNYHCVEYVENVGIQEVLEETDEKGDAAAAYSEDEEIQGETRGRSATEETEELHSEAEENVEEAGGKKEGTEESGEEPEGNEGNEGNCQEDVQDRAHQESDGEVAEDERDSDEDILDLLRAACHHMKIRCDGCLEYIKITRFICVDCTTWLQNHGVDNTSDICPMCQCAQNPRKFTGIYGAPHEPTHCMIQMRRTLHDLDLDLIPRATKIVDNWRAVAQKSKATQVKALAEEKRHCTRCREIVGPTFWRCIECEANVAICNECNNRENLDIASFTLRGKSLVQLQCRNYFQRRHHWTHTLICGEYIPNTKHGSGGQKASNEKKEQAGEQLDYTKDLRADVNALKEEAAAQKDKIAELGETISRLVQLLSPSGVDKTEGSGAEE